MTQASLAVTFSEVPLVCRSLPGQVWTTDSMLVDRTVC